MWAKSDIVASSFAIYSKECFCHNAFELSKQERVILWRPASELIDIALRIWF